MQKKIVDLGGWSRRNLWPLPSGEIAVRPGLREVHDFGTATVLGGFSVRDDLTGEVFHYTFELASNVQINIRIFDEFLNLVNIYTDSFLATTVLPSQVFTVTHAVVNGRLVIAVPGMAPLTGYIGGALKVAEKRASSINPDYTTQALPRGIVCGWANRAVYAEGNLLQFSDAADPLSIVSLNFVNPEGEHIYGLHESGAGALVVVTTNGVYELSREAAARGQIVSGVIRKVCDYVSAGYGTSCVNRGRVWGTSAKGVRLIDTPEPYELPLAEPRVPATSNPVISSTSFRDSKMFRGENGFVLSPIGSNTACLLDESSKAVYWWFASSTLEADAGFEVVGTLFDYDGSLMLLTEGGILKPYGNYDTGDDTVVGSFLGRVKTHPGQSRTLRHVEASSDTGQSLYCSVAGNEKTSAPPQTGVILNTTAINSTGTWLDAPLRSRSFSFSSRTDDHGLEVGAQGPLSRVEPVIAVQMGGVEPERESN